MEKSITNVKSHQPVLVKRVAEIITIKAAAPVVITPAPTIVVQPQRVEVTKIRPAPAVKVKPPDRGAWDERGWKRNGNSRRDTYAGYYFVGNRKFPGRIEVHGLRSHTVTAYIYDPPREVKSHPHGACFQLVGDNWFHLHWSHPARNVDDAILYMERVLDESLTG